MNDSKKDIIESVLHGSKGWVGRYIVRFAANAFNIRFIIRDATSDIDYEIIPSSLANSSQELKTINLLFNENQYQILRHKDFGK